MRPIHLAAIVVGLAAAIWGVKMLSTSPEPKAEAAGPVVDAAHAGEAAAPHAQIEICGGPEPRKPEDTSLAPMGSVRSPAEVEADRRRAALAEVLGKLQSAPVYVEGVDGVPPDDPKAPKRR